MRPGYRPCDDAAVERVVLLAHGAGSSPDVVRRLLAPCLPADAEVVAPELRADVESAVRALAAAADGREVVLAGGISLGAHALALLAARTGADHPLVLAMPAWTGAPGDVAAATAAAAADLAVRGRATVLASIAADPLTRDDWVRAELEAGWATYDDDELVTALRAASVSHGPSLDELGAVRAPVAVVALDDDPLHPASVAQQWAAAVPRSRFSSVARHAPAADRGALGRAAALALADLSGSR
jgi:pimeloyl-ACP methyl ester carboxylesterase